MKKIVPVIWFEKDGEKAAEYYTSVFPNSELKDEVRGADDYPRATIYQGALRTSGEGYTKIYLNF